MLMFPCCCTGVVRFLFIPVGILGVQDALPVPVTVHGTVDVIFIRNAVEDVE